MGKLLFSLVPVVLALSLFTDTNQTLGQADPPDKSSNGITLSDIEGKLLEHPTDPSIWILEVTCTASFSGTQSVTDVPVINAGTVELFVFRGWRMDDDDPEGGAKKWFEKVDIELEFLLSTPADREVPPNTIRDLTFPATLRSTVPRYRIGGRVEWILKSEQKIVWSLFGDSIKEGPQVSGSNVYGPEPGYVPSNLQSAD